MLVTHEYPFLVFMNNVWQPRTASIYLEIEASKNQQMIPIRYTIYKPIKTKSSIFLLRHAMYTSNMHEKINKAKDILR